MKLTRLQLKKIILQEMKKNLAEQFALVKKLQTAGKMSLDTFRNSIKAIQSMIKNPDEKAYLEIVSDITKRWGEHNREAGLRHWMEAMPDEDKILFLRKTFPGRQLNNAENIVIGALQQGGKKAEFLLHNIGITAANMAKEIEIGAGQLKPGEYLGAEEPGGEPKSPYWKEFLEEEISPAAPIGIEKEPEMQEKYPYWILLNDDVPVMFPRGYEEEAINTYNIMMEREGSVKEISQKLTELIQASGDGNE